MSLFSSWIFQRFCFWKVSHTKCLLIPLCMCTKQICLKRHPINVFMLPQCLNGPIEFLLIQTWNRFNCSIVVVNLMLRSPHLLYLDCFSLVIGYHCLNEKNVLENCCNVMYYSEVASHFPEIVYGFKVLSVCLKSYCFVLVFIYYI